jgi:hypothetical protein
MTKNHSTNKIIASGASISDSPWFTWIDFLEQESGISVTNLCHRGAGNECIVTSLAQHSHMLDSNSLVVIMFTNIDKFDWYVEKEQFEELQKEKHPPYSIGTRSGFWSTGSWFPNKKKLFQENFYNHDSFCAKTIQQILLTQSICNQRGSKLEVFFDSPIWNWTESDLNQIGDMDTDRGQLKKHLLCEPLSTIWSGFLPTAMKDIENSSLIGYCWSKNLPWYHPKLRGHPPSTSHYQYYQDIMRPRLSQHLQLNHGMNIKHKLNKFDEQWKNY